MSEQKALLSAETIAEIQRWVKKFPEGEERAAICAALHIVQKENGGHLTDELMAAIAEQLKLTPIEVVEVATFYDMCEFSPIGRYKLSICTNVSCMLTGSDEIVDHLQKRLGIKMGETTSDGMFTLREAECLASCVTAPMLQVNDERFQEYLTVEKVDALLERLRLEATQEAANA